MFFGYLIKTDLKNIEKQFKLEINMTQLIKDSVAKAMDYSQYNTLFGELVAAGKTTGEETQEKIDYTKLNYSRTKRLDKTATIDSDAATIFKNVENKQTWLDISEPWRSEEHTSELESRPHIACRLLHEKKTKYDL